MKRSRLRRSGRVFGSVQMGRDPRRFVDHKQKYRILNRDGWLCKYCGVPLSFTDALIDHVIPWSQGGRTEDDNLVACCRACNKQKGNQPVEVFVKALADYRGGEGC